jgi:O-antigen/teichoic acid export membrane protein
MAYKITSLPMTEVSDVIQKVTFSVYAKISGDIKRLKRAYFKSLGITALLIIPIGFILFYFPEPLIKILLGEKWLIAAPIIKIMAFIGVIRALIEVTYPLFLSLKKQNYVTLITLASLTALLISVVPLVKTHGLMGAGMSALIGAVAGIPVTVLLLTKTFQK